MTESDLLRFPTGPFRPPAASTADTRHAQVEALRLLPERLRLAVSGLSDAQLDTPYREGGWTVRQVVHHVADSHMNSFVRFKLALTEDWPTVKPYDEAAWAKLADSELAIDGSLVFIDALHARWVALLKSIPDADFEKRGFHHPQNGQQTLGLALAYYGWHAQHHTAHINSLREREGW